jgi:hypothetical protein
MSMLKISPAIIKQDYLAKSEILVNNVFRTRTKTI